MELGPIQKRWLAEMRAHPERQSKGELGHRNGGELCLCCLGQALLTLAEYQVVNIQHLWENDHLYDMLSSSGVLDKSYNDIGLHTSDGEFIEPVVLGNRGLSYLTLVELNDRADISWPEIADIIEANPKNVFTKSV